MSTIFKCATAALVLSDVSANYQKGVKSGHYIETSDVAVKICGVKRQTDCKVNGDSYHFAMEFADWNSVGAVRETNATKELEDNYNGWQCGGDGETLFCDTGKAISGGCGTDTGANHRCEAPNCDNKDAIHAIKCTSPPAHMMVTKEKQTMAPTDTGDWGECPSGFVACGNCLSDSDPHCDGDWNQLTCCKYLDCTPKKNIGSWVYIGSGSSKETSFSFTWGMSYSSSISHTTQYTETVSKSVSAGFKFESGASGGMEVGSSQSTMVAENMQESFAAEYSATLTAKCPFEPWVSWKWQMETEGDCPSTTTAKFDYACTASSSEPPCCLPGDCKDTHCQTCIHYDNVCDAK